MTVQKPYQTITDYITGKAVPDIGAEANRQAVEKFLVNQKGYSKTDIEVDVPLSLNIAGEPYLSRVDLVVSVNAVRAMIIKCAAGSLGSREREAVSAARLLGDDQIPLAVVSDGREAAVMDTLTGKKRGAGIDAIPARDSLAAYVAKHPPRPLPENRREREKLVFRTYDIENVNIRKNIPSEDGSP